jgi:hypothetical protein
MQSYDSKTDHPEDMSFVIQNVVRDTKCCSWYDYFGIDSNLILLTHNGTICYKINKLRGMAQILAYIDRSMTDRDLMIYGEVLKATATRRGKWDS